MRGTLQILYASIQLRLPTAISPEISQLGTYILKEQSIYPQRIRTHGTV